MNARFLGLFSGFPTCQFTDAIAERLKEELSVRDSLVFVSAWPSEYARNDDDAAGMHGMFEKRDMPFQRFCVIDDRTESMDAKRLVREASCIFLMGGHATQQFQLIREKGISEEIRRSAAVILGVSAGSSNMARRALDIWESHVPYEGLGLIDLTIKAHMTQENQELKQMLLKISAEHNLPICAMEDESAIFIKDDVVTYTGHLHGLAMEKCEPLPRRCLTSDRERRFRSVTHKTLRMIRVHAEGFYYVSPFVYSTASMISTRMAFCTSIPRRVSAQNPS